MKIILLTCLMVWCVPADACYARLVEQYEQGIDRICVYAHRNDTVTTVVPLSKNCRGMIYVDH